MKYNRILAIGGHVGDMELTCGGVLATCAAAGGHIATLALTGGEKGNPPGQTPEEYRVQKVQEAEHFARILGGNAYVLDYADGLLPDDDTVRFQVCDIIRREKPDLILTHHGKSMHKDHAACHRIVKDAWFYAAIGGFQRELPPTSASCVLPKTGKMPRTSGPISIWKYRKPVSGCGRKRCRHTGL